MRQPSSSRAALGWLLLCSLVLGCAGGPPVLPASHSFGRMAMGTVLEITLLGADPRQARAAADAAFAEVAELENLASRHDPGSQLSALNAAAGGAPQPVDPRLHALIRRSVELAALTEGSFDVTVGPIVELWIEAARSDRVPSPQEIETALARTGASRIALEPERVGLPLPGMSLDLGGIAKGHALDAVAERLRVAGHRDALLHFGRSSVQALGRAPDGGGWRLLLPALDAGDDAVLTLSDRALSVSSSLGQWSEIGGRRFGHVVDPRTGSALVELRRSAVVAPDATLAEALSTALTILDVEAGLALVEAQPGVEARIEDGSGVLGTSSGWHRLSGATAPERRDRAHTLRSGA